MIPTGCNLAYRGFDTERYPTPLIFSMTKTQLAIVITTTPKQFSCLRQQQAMILARCDDADRGFVTERNPARLIFSMPKTQLTIVITTTPKEFSRFRQQQTMICARNDGANLQPITTITIPLRGELLEKKP